MRSTNKDVPAREIEGGGLSRALLLDCDGDWNLVSWLSLSLLEESGGRRVGRFGGRGDNGSHFRIEVVGMWIDG